MDRIPLYNNTAISRRSVQEVPGREKADVKTIVVELIKLKVLASDASSWCLLFKDAVQEFEGLRAGAIQQRRIRLKENLG